MSRPRLTKKVIRGLGIIADLAQADLEEGDNNLYFFDRKMDSDAWRAIEWARQIESWYWKKHEG